MEELAVAALPRFITSSHKLSLFDEVVFNNLRLGSGTVPMVYSVSVDGST